MRLIATKQTVTLYSDAREIEERLAPLQLMVLSLYD